MTGTPESSVYLEWVNRLRTRHYGHHSADDILKYIFLNKNVWISIKISPEFVPKCPISNISALVQTRAWCRPDYNPLFEPRMVRLTRHICVIRLQWVKGYFNVQSHHKIHKVNLHFWIQTRFCQIIWITFIFDDIHHSRWYAAFPCDK